MAKLTGVEERIKKISREAVKTIQSTKTQNELEDYLYGLIFNKQTDATGKSFPKKKDSTKKAYKRSGYDTEHWLVRTGVSVEVITKKIQKGIQLNPKDPAKILKYVKQSDEWFRLNPEIKETIIKIIYGELNAKHLLTTK